MGELVARPALQLVVAGLLANRGGRGVLQLVHLVELVVVDVR